MLEFSTPSDAACWLREHVTGTLQSDNRRLQAGDGFIAWPGAASDARQHVARALAQGAAACLVEKTGVETYGFSDPRVASYKELKAASGPIAAAYFMQPSQQLKLLAVTGTNGKTSSVWWLAHALSNLKQVAPVPCAMVGTLGVGRPPVVQSTGLTTPDPVLLQKTLREFVDSGVVACAIEASSIGLAESRLQGCQIHSALFTNFTQDHLDYHGSMQAYWQAKRELFAWPGLRAAVVNVDDPKGLELLASLDATALDVWSLSCLGPARLQACDISHEARGLRFTVRERGADDAAPAHVLQTSLIGLYNVSNLLGVLAAMRSIGVPLTAALDACAVLAPVPGRMEFVGQPGQTLVAVDYAHTPDALAQALLALRPVSRQRGGQLWCVFGCGGDRDATKRPLMGAMAASYADQVVLTSDNPRSEKPEAIISQILLGCRGQRPRIVEPDRALAIAQTLAQAAPEDVVLLAGKGHEDYQEVAGRRLPFSDLEQVRRLQGKPLVQPIGGEVCMAEMLNLLQAQQWLGAARLVGDCAGAAAVGFLRVHSDTRTLEPGDLFVALRGERFDANDFLVEAKARGAVAALCQGDADERLRAAGLPGLVVADAQQALGLLAAKWRAQFTLPVIAVTGSNGKTTVTQMIASILRTCKPEAWLATQGNLNNAIGVPLSVLRLRAHHELAVFELGMNHPGEIAQLAAIVQPTVALVNNAQREHLEFMATVAAVAQENGSVIDALPDDGTAVFPSDDAFSALWLARAGVRSVTQFSAAAGALADIRCTAANWSGEAWQVTLATAQGVLRYALHIAGLHNVKNSLAAVACALAAGVSLPAIARGLEAFEPVKGRSRAQLLKCGGHAVTLVDDSYNANPDSVRAAIEVLATLPAPHLLVLGDMGEVGDQGPAFHAEAGALARSLGVDALFTLGDLSQAAASSFGAGRHFGDMASLQQAVLAQLNRVGSVLVKGSRFMKMERVVAALTDHVVQDKEEINAA